MRSNDDEKAELKRRLIQDFNTAPSLCAYNAVLFDIPFMTKQLEIDNETVQNWLLKLIDPFHTMKTCFGVTCKLDKMLALNGLQCKSASGLQAIEMARDGDWVSLVNYCMDDVRLTVDICVQDKIILFKHTGACVYYRAQFANHLLTLFGPHRRVLHLLLICTRSSFLEHCAPTGGKVPPFSSLTAAALWRLPNERNRQSRIYRTTCSGTLWAGGVCCRSALPESAFFSC